MGKITELVVTKGKTVKATDREEWDCVEYSVKASIDHDEELQVAKAELEGVLTGWLSAYTLAVPEVTEPTTTLPQLDPDELAKLPWKTYKTKEECKPDQAGWIFRNTQGAEALADVIERQGNGVQVQVGSHKFELKFSGSTKQFIGRAPAK